MVVDMGIRISYPYLFTTGNVKFYPIWEHRLMAYPILQLGIGNLWRIIRLRSMVKIKLRLQGNWFVFYRLHPEVQLKQKWIVRIMV